MKTTVAITSQNKKTVTNHAGKCLNFLIYTIENDEITNKRVIELQADEILKHTIQKDQNIDSNNWLFDVNILLTGSMGNSAKEYLARQNVAAFIIREKDPEITIEKLINGTLEAFVPAVQQGNGRGNCNNHHHHHHHEHNHEGGCNHNHGEGGCHHHHH